MHSLKRLALTLLVLQLLAGWRCTPDKTSGCKNPLASNYDNTVEVHDACACQYNGLDQTYDAFQPTALNIPAIRQETAVWCWLAVGKMIFRYYAIPNVNQVGDYQCGIIGALGYTWNGACDKCNLNCANCIRPAGDAQAITDMITAFPKVASRKLFTKNKSLRSQFVTNFLAANFLVSELDAKRPVIAGINPGPGFVLPGNSQHVALVVGYFYSGANLILVVNDPYPYFVSGFDPYLFNGAVASGGLRYHIPYTNFVNGLKWNTSWFGIGW